MALFDKMLSSNESLFKDEIALSFDYIPKIVPYREAQQRHIASCIAPLFSKRNGKSLFISGRPGIGKTVAVRHVLGEVEEKTDDIIPLYINCWQKNTSFKIAIELCEQLGYKLTMNKRTDELFSIAKQMLNKKECVLVFDEVDKLEEFDILYHILEEVYRRAVIIITNGKEWLGNLDERLRSRLSTEVLEFRPYTQSETDGILRQRIQYAFVAGIWEPEAISLVSERTSQLQDIRSGLFLLKEAGEIAEAKASRKITLDHAREAITKLADFEINSSQDLDTDAKKVLDIIKGEQSEIKSGDLFRKYQEAGGTASYKTMHRTIKKLEQGKLITLRKVEGGKEGTTSLIRLNTVKKLTEF